MVISIIRLFCLCLGFIFAISCNVDLLGLIAAGDIDERLKSADTFHFVKERDITTEENYSFLVLTDTHISGKNAFGLEKLKNHFIQSDKFIVVTGDITQSGNREEVERFM